MHIANKLHESLNQRLYLILINLFIFSVYTALLFYAVYLLYAGAEKLHAYFISWITAANDHVNFCFR